MLPSSKPSAESSKNKDTGFSCSSGQQLLVSLATGGATLVPQPGYWQSAANASELHLCPRRSACRYDERTSVLSKCQADWYALEADTSLNYDQLQVAQARLPCDLWTANSSDYS